jgi:DNA polymerase III subunit delta
MIYKSYEIETNINLLLKDNFLFYGENLGLKNEFKNKIKINNKNAEVLIFTQDEILKNERLFYNEISNISLFQKKKIYFIEQSNDKILSLLQDIAPILNDQQLVVFSEILDKRSKLRNYFEKENNYAAVACYNDNEIIIKKIILKKLEKFKGLSAHNINMIINSCNLDRVKLNNELNKIITYFSNKIIEDGKLELLLNDKVNSDFNILRDEAFCGNKLKTNSLLSDTIIETEKNILYLSMINQRLNKLAETYILIENSNLEKAISMLKPPIFWKDKPMFIIQAKKWSLNKIKNILKETYLLEIEIKSNPIINKNILMKKLLVDICTQANV